MNKRKNLSYSILSTALICGIFAPHSFSAPQKKKKKSTVTPACIACLNSFDSQTLKFTIDVEKCPKRVAKCYKTNYSSQCEDTIKDCIEYNCKTPGTCADEIGNRNLFAGCLKAVNIVLPYQCASYISGYASTKAAELKAIATAKANALKEKEMAIQAAAEETKRAQVEAEKQAKIAAEQEATKRKQMESEAQIKLEQEKARLEQQAKDAELARQQKAAKEAKLNRPNARYNTLIAETKQALNTAKTFTSKAYNLLGIEKTNKKIEENQGNAVFFAQQVVTVKPLDTEKENLDNETTKTRFNTHAQGSRYWEASLKSNNSTDKQETANFICTKDTKESIIKNELKNAYNTLKKANDNLIAGISDVEIANEDDDSSGKISESKIDTLYDASADLSKVIALLDSHIAQLKTSCETRCNGMSSMNIITTITDAPIEYDERGNIIEEKRSKNEEYTCKDFDKENNSNDLVSLISQSDGVSSMIGGLGKKVTELTKRVVKGVIESDREIDLTLAKIQSGAKSARNGSYSSGNSTSESDACISYLFSSSSKYIQCLIDNAQTQNYKFTKDETNNTLRNELRRTIEIIIKEINNEITTTNKGSIKKEDIPDILYCGKKNDDDGKIIFDETILKKPTEFNGCLSELANIVRKIKDYYDEQEEQDRRNRGKKHSSSSDTTRKWSLRQDKGLYVLTVDSVPYTMGKADNNFAQTFEWENVDICNILIPTNAQGTKETVEDNYLIECTCKNSDKRNITLGAFRRGDDIDCE